MGLKINQSLRSEMPLRYIGGVPSDRRSFFGRTDRFNATIGEGIFNLKAAVPTGTYPPGVLQMARTAGAIRAKEPIQLTIILSPATLSNRKAIIGESNIITSASATGQLAYRAVGNLQIDLTVSASGKGIKYAAGEATITSTLTGATIGQGKNTGTVSAVLTATAISQGTGNLQGTIGGTDALTPDGIANAVIFAMNTAVPAVNIKKVNDYMIDGMGTELDPWGPA